MSWHDPARTPEPDADALLREELRALLAVGPRNEFEVEATPELILLADDLRREAKRRNRTTRKQHSWMLMAAALPFALVLGGVSAWGVAQKHKAEGYAAAIQQKDAELQRMAAASRPRPIAPAQSTALAPAVVQVASHAPKARPKGMELVIPVERSAQPILNDTQQVKGH
jgi:hypothetical protein